MRKLIIALIFVALSVALFAQMDDADAFAKFMAKEKQAYENFKLQDRLNFEKFKEQIEREWNEFKQPTQKNWVSYSQDFKGRGQVDFEQGTVQVEAVMDKNDPSALDKAKEMVKKQLEAIIKTEDEKNSSILDGQVAVPEKVQKDVGAKVVTEKNVDEVAEAIVKNSKPVTVTGGDGKQKVKYQIDMNMLPDHIKTRAAKYRPNIEKYCKQNQVPVALALGIIHTESFFNPKAYNSRGNAYGLMQVVPTSAGRTMNRKLNNRDSDPTDDQLLDPETNIKFGIGFLRHLMNYFEKTKVDGKPAKVVGTNNMWCIIPSYNGGYGQVFYALTGKMNRIGKAWEPMWKNLREMDSEKLYKKLVSDMPAAESRDYLEKVRDRMENVYGWKR